MTNIPVLEVLIEARSYITQEEHFTRDTFAKDATGRSVPPSDPTAISFCAIGALLKAKCDYQSYNKANDALDMVSESRGYGNILHANDTKGWEIVLQIYDDAILREKIKLRMSGVLVKN